MEDLPLIELGIRASELPPRLEAKIIGIVRRKIERYSLSFDQAYQYAVELIEKFIAYRERFGISLDSTSGETGKRTLHEIIGVEDANLQLLLGSTTRGLLPTYKAVRILGNHISELALHTLKQLTRFIRGNHVLNISPDQLITGAGKIEDRLERLAKKYAKDGRLVIPRRPIVYVAFNPLLVRFGNRRYNGNPRAFYLQNIDAYGGMSRSQLYDFDGGLYRSLRLAGQLDVVPTKRPHARPHAKHRKYGQNPLDYIQKHPDEFREISRGQLNRCYRKLWEALKRNGQLDSIPSRLPVYSDYELQLLRRKIDEGASLEELATTLGRTESGVVQKLASLSKEDNNQWSKDTSNNYWSQWQRKNTNEIRRKGTELRKPLMKEFSRIDCIDPLSFFREHTEVYGSMSRSELYYCHHNLYNALKDKGQLDEAVPMRKSGRKKKDEP